MDFNNLDNSDDFFSSYVSKIQEAPSHEEQLEDENDYYTEESNDDDDNGGYDFSTDDDTDNSDDYYQTGGDDDGTPQSEDDSLYDAQGGESDYLGYGNNAPITSLGPSSLSKKISGKESGGKYNIENKQNPNNPAVGKYQFKWRTWGDSIKSITGVKSKDEFKNSPQAQEKYFSWYEKNILGPQSKAIKKFNGKLNLSDEQIERLIHFRGKTGAIKYLKGQLSDKPESYNSSISDYIGLRQMGGGTGVAMSSAAQYHGLNNPSFQSMIFPMEGENEFRGLDDGTPVYLEDEDGKKVVLKNKHHKTKLKGVVYETRNNKKRKS